MRFGIVTLALMASVSPALAAPLVGGSLTGAFVSAEGRVSADGLEGEWRELGDLRTGAFAIHSDLGAYQTADIYDGRTRWEVDPSGGHHPLNSPFAQQAATTEAWLARFVLSGGDRREATWSSPTFAVDGALHYRIFNAVPKGGQPVQLWFDAADDRLVKATRQGWFFTLTTTYADYRDVDGTGLPFTIVNSAVGRVESIKVKAYNLTSSAPPNTFAQPAQPEDATVPSSGTTVPMLVYPQLTVRASVNGQPMDFLFDTGGHSILTPDAAKSLNLLAVGGQQTGGSGTGTLLQQDTRVNELRIGDAVLRDQHFFVLPLSYSDVEQGAKPPLAGLLGLEVAERFVVRLDYRSGTFSLLPRTSTPICRSGWRPIRFTYDMPTVDARLDGRPAAFTVDTGNNGGLLLYQHWLQESGAGSQYDRGVKTLAYGAGGASVNWISYATSFSIGEPSIPKPMVRTTNDKGGVALSVAEAGNLGTSLLANYTITLDYARSRGCFDYVPGYTPLPFNRAGLRAIKEDPKSILITLVNDGGPAQQAGLRKDDRIIAVDGVPASQMGEGDLTVALTRPPGSRVTLRFERGGVESVTTLTTREMLK
jgi:hypothetical protein